MAQPRVPLINLYLHNRVPNFIQKSKTFCG